jgi:hypothetical protein
MKDFLDQLAELDVREPPPDFNRKLHDRVNRTLLAQHLIDFVVGGISWSLVHFFRATLGWVLFTLTGRYGDQKKR